MDRNQKYAGAETTSACAWAGKNQSQNEDGVDGQSLGAAGDPCELGPRKAKTRRAGKMNHGLGTRPDADDRTSGRDEPSSARRKASLEYRVAQELRRKPRKENHDQQ
jgi:hypothetical protein